MIGFDPLYLLFVVPCLLFASYAQMRVHSAFSRYSRAATKRGLTGAEVAQAVLEAAQVPGVRIEESHGFLSDHYDPSSRTLRLSPKVYHEPSIAAAGIAAHEAGHAIQHARGYAPLQMRSALVPMAGLGSWLSWPLLMMGLALQSTNMILLGVLLFSMIVVFQIVTLPVEYDASARAKEALAHSGLLVGSDETDGVATILNAAALTYVAATITAIMQLLYFLFRAGLLHRSSDE